MRLACFSLIAFCLIVSLSCDSANEDVERRLIIIGIDGFDWKLIDPLIDSGPAPNLEKLKTDGSWGQLMSLVPLEKSPVIWTTISTGRTPDQHGVGGFVTGIKQSLTTGNTIQTRHIWEVLGAFEKRVAVVNWWVTWPASPVNGLLVSDYFQAVQRGGKKEVEDLTYPAEFREEVNASTLEVAERSKESIGFLMDGSWDNPKDPNIIPLLRSLREIYASDMITLEVTEHILETRSDLDFYAFYFRGIDSASHRFWGSMDPASLKGTVRISDIQASMFGNTIPRYYAMVDSVIGQVLSYVDKERDTVILCSDHGFQGPYIDEQGYKGGIKMHRPEGVVVLYGKDIQAGVNIENATVYDIAPTVLTLFGLPVARDMSGKPLLSAISDDFVRQHPVAYIDTYEMGENTSEKPVSSPIDESLREELRTLGYID